jgi:hypothetical protein
MPVSPADQMTAQPEKAVAPKVGDTIYDNTGASVGTVASLAADTGCPGRRYRLSWPPMPVVLAADAGKATIPISSLGTGEKGLMVNTTKAQIDAAIAAAAKGKPAT